MVQLKNILFIALFSIFIIQPTQAQSFLKKLSDRAMKKANNDIKDKSKDKKKDKEESIGAFDLKGLMKGIGLETTPVATEDTYYFDHLIQMHIESYDQNGNKTSDGDFITHFDPKSKSMAYQAISGDMANKGQGMFIVDTKNQATIILSEENGQKSGIVYGMGGYFETLGEEIEEEDIDMEETPETYMANPNITKTGRTKTIAGYKCEEYVYKNEDGKSNIWITKDLKLNTRDFLSALYKASTMSNGMGWGYIMEATTVENSGEKSIMKVTRVDSNSNIKFSLKDYEITNLGTFQPPSEEE